MATATATRTRLPQGMRFEEPPAIRRNSVWKRKLAVVKDHPGRWIRVRADYTPDQAHNTAAALKNGRLSVPDGDGEWKFAAREVPGENTYGLYARFDPA